MLRNRGTLSPMYLKEMEQLFNTVNTQTDLKLIEDEFERFSSKFTTFDEVWSKLKR